LPITSVIFAELHLKCKQEAQLMLTNLRNAFRGQSMSPNMAPFSMLGMVFCWCAIVSLSLKTLFFRYSTCNYTVTLKCG